MEKTRQDLDLVQELNQSIEEARMVLPGLQALFGFQTIAVFNERFGDLPEAGRYAHLLALLLVVLSIGLIMTPAPYCRIAEPGRVTRHAITLTSRLIGWAMAPLAIALGLEVACVLILAEFSNAAAGAAGSTVALLLLSLWIVFPLGRRKN
jgi:hypothetical protein